jgi:iron(III) transport system ATP-binding protein
LGIEALGMSMIELRSVSKDYAKFRAVDALSMGIEPGERVILFGPSGCGKSTVLHLIAGLLVPEAGEIWINGELVARTRKNLKEPSERGVGMVFQDLALWPHMSVSETLEFGLRAKGVPAPERKWRVGEMANLVGLGAYLSAKPGALSGGQQQRVALARTLVVEPRIVLMDEPMSNLDDALAEQLRAEILRLQNALGFTLVYVTHNKEEIAALGARTIRLHQGRIAPAPGAI